jgi:uncharacterized cupin superfamily protein
LISEERSMAETTAIRLNRDGPEGTGLPFWGNLEGETVIEGDPVETGFNYFTDRSGQLTAGVWECTPCTTLIESYPVDEFCYILSGTVVISGEDGRTETFTAGDCFVMRKGTKCTWHMPETTRKYYVIFEDKGST